MKTKIIVSACLLGAECRYDSKSNKNDEVLALANEYELVSVCPECFGGLPTPRPPAEIKNGRVINVNGEDVTDNFVLGAEQTLYVAKECNAPCAVLKANSPSCGFGKIYDGSFTKTKIDANGVTAQLLYDNDIQIFTENEIRRLKNLY